MNLTAPDSIYGPLFIVVRVFCGLAQQAVAAEPVPYAGLVKGILEGDIENTRLCCRCRQVHTPLRLYKKNTT
ncbi:MAG: hypothetical protein A2W74_08040 [Planctomycetes bacterium RIFCSPLOWO2_12_38_17]|nr:MAG: hypothetical protein A2W74_08040 [Planctomycetes bacterium RIFCSPLOWO2_12_38_17]